MSKIVLGCVLGKVLYIFVGLKFVYIYKFIYIGRSYREFLLFMYFGWVWIYILNGKDI